MADYTSVTVRPFDLREIFVYVLQRLGDAAVGSAQTGTNIVGFYNGVEYMESLVGELAAKDETYINGINNLLDDSNDVTKINTNVAPLGSNEYSMEYQIRQFRYANKKLAFVIALMWRKNLFTKLSTHAEV